MHLFQQSAETLNTLGIKSVKLHVAVQLQIITPI